MRKLVIFLIAIIALLLVFFLFRQTSDSLQIETTSDIEIENPSESKNKQAVLLPIENSKVEETIDNNPENSPHEITQEPQAEKLESNTQFDESSIDNSYRLLLKDILKKENIVAVDSAGKASVYQIRLSDGNIAVLSFSHSDVTGGHYGEFGEGYLKHWYQADHEAPIVIVDRTSSKWKPSIIKAAQLWSVSSVINLIVNSSNNVISNAEQAVDECYFSLRPGVITVCDLDFNLDPLTQSIADRSGYALMVISPDVDGGHAGLTDRPTGHAIFAGIMLNQKSPLLDPEKYTPKQIDAWYQHLACHELGHTIGLGHNDEDFKTHKNTCMDYSDRPDAEVEPNSHDYEELEITHGHLHNNKKNMGKVCSSGNLIKDLKFTNYFGVIPANDFFKMPYAPERKTDGKWVALSKMITDDGGFIVQVDQSKMSSASVIFNEQSYTSPHILQQYGIGAIDPGPNHTYFEPNNSYEKTMDSIAESLNARLQMGYFKDCKDWEIDISELIWDTDLKYYLKNSRELRAKQREIELDQREK